MTPAKLMRRVKIEPDTGCWIWMRGCNRHTIPQLNVDGVSTSARRHIFEVFNGRKLPRHLFAACPCDDQKCVNPTHTKIVSKSAYLAMARARGIVFHSAVTVAKITMARRAGSKVLNADKVREIRRRAAVERYAVVALDFGINPHYVGKIFRNEAWREARSPIELLAQQAGML